MLIGNTNDANQNIRGFRKQISNNAKRGKDFSWTKDQGRSCDLQDTWSDQVLEKVGGLVGAGMVTEGHGEGEGLGGFRGVHGTKFLFSSSETV